VYFTKQARKRERGDNHTTMEGRGVTNYAVGKPSCGFSTATSEFSDALMSRGIVTFEQAMVAKGATPDEACHLAELNRNGNDSSSAVDNTTSSGLRLKYDTNSSQQQLGDGYDDVSDADASIGGDDDEDDDQFIEKYRRMRIHDMKKGRKQEYGDVIPISRPDWNREVNEASKNGLWVIVNLTRISSMSSRTKDEMCDKVEEATRDLADKFVHVKFVSIPSTSAIENWPEENLPTVFCYRYGKMQHQLVGVGAMGGMGVNSGRLEWRLAMLGVFDTELEDDPRPDRTESAVDGVGSRGTVSRLATTRDYDSDDFDDVD